MNLNIIHQRKLMKNLFVAVLFAVSKARDLVQYSDTTDVEEVDCVHARRVQN